METNQEHENQPQENAHPQDILEDPNFSLLNPDYIIKYLRKQAITAIFAFLMVHFHHRDDENAPIIRERRTQKTIIDIICGLTYIVLIPFSCIICVIAYSTLMPFCCVFTHANNNRNREGIGMNH